MDTLDALLAGELAVAEPAGGGPAGGLNTAIQLEPLGLSPSGKPASPLVGQVAIAGTGAVRPGPVL